MDISVALTSVSTALSIAKTVSDIDKDFDASVYKLQMAELRSALAEAKLALADVQDQLRAKDQEIHSLRTLTTSIEDLVQQGDFLYDKDEEGRPSGRPYCPRCLEKRVGLFHLHQVPGKPRDTCLCGECKNTYDRAFRAGR